jgi:hypothetical protein
MSLELLNTIASLTTALVIAATAIAALIQLRHMRAGNQISAFLTLRSMLDQPEHRLALALVRLKLDKMLEDPGFRAFLEGTVPEETTPRTDEYQAMSDAARLIGNTYDAVGTLVRNRIIDSRLFFEQYGSVVDRDWLALEVATDYYRRRIDHRIWEDFEYITALARRFSRERPTTYPHDVARIELHNPWRS